ncbi:MAG: OsmC family protein [Crocinitomicaceae bacterium]|nr:OsmC family protein [Crocinitomicaceae bacterium]MDG1777586.1 OsmC family protein [Crocinitomicaceae bacterium]
MGSGCVSGELKEGYTVVNSARGHQWVSDESKELDGQDLGPEPMELLLSSLVSCKLITLKMYAARKGWDVDGLKIYLSLIGGEGVTVVEKRFEFSSNLSDQQRERLIYISGKCPVVKILSRSISFKVV